MFINELERGKSIEGQFIVENVAFRKTKTDSEYAIFELKDRTGTVKALNWSPPKTVDSGGIFDISGTVTEYNNQLRVDVKQMIQVESGKIDRSRFIEEPAVSISTLKSKLFDTVNRITDKDYRSLVLSTLDEKTLDKFANHPAAKLNHHAYPGGLLNHSISVADNAETLGKKYSANISLLIAGALLHDIGKIHEMEFDLKADYTAEGVLLGHISIGFGLVFETGRKLGTPAQKLNHLLHLVLSHHAKLEYGSPVTPMSKEAHILALSDDLDFRMDLIDNNRPKEGGGDFASTYMSDFRKIYYDSSGSPEYSQGTKKDPAESKDGSSDKKSEEPETLIDEIII
jgi:3'-5' exoribonuclease